MDARENTPVSSVKIPDMELMLALRRKKKVKAATDRNGEENPTEPSASRFHPSRFWRAAVANGRDVEERGGGESEDSDGESYLPRFKRGMGFKESDPAETSKTAWFTEVDDPLPCPPEEEFKSVAWSTIVKNPHLFRVHTPISVERLESFLNGHPNQAFVRSVLVSLREGFWPWASTRPTDQYPEMWDNSWAPHPSNKEREFINAQCKEEILVGRHSPAFGPDLLPGMYSTPVIAVQPHSEKLRLVANQSANQSAGEFCQNSMVDRSQTRGARMDSLVVFILLVLAFKKSHPGKKLVIWKSDVMNAFRLIPMHPLWQVKQVVTAGLPMRSEAMTGPRETEMSKQYVDWMACFGNSGSPRAWASVMGLVVWIAIFVLQMLYLCCYVDNCFSVAEEEDIEYYAPYDSYFLKDQVALMRLWDYLGIPHKRDKQLWGPSLAVIGLLVDPNVLTVTLPEEGKSDLISHVRDFANSRHRPLQEWQKLAGWMDWLFNVFPMLQLALANVYFKMGGKVEQHAQIFVNKTVKEDLLWFVEHVETSSGVRFFENSDWNPLADSELVVYGDACL